MSDDERPLREQLIEARDNVRRQLEILRSPSTIGGGAEDHSVVAELEAELQQLEEALADFDMIDSPATALVGRCL